MRTQSVATLLGKLLGAYALFLLIPLSYAIFRQEAAYSAFLLAALVSGALGILLSRLGCRECQIGIREGFLVVAGAWILTSLLGALPYYTSGSVPTYIDGVFETVSGLTTTGASIIADVEIMPESILLWRSLTHWLGGMGIIVLFLVFLTSLGAGAVNLFRAEAPGPTVDRVLPRIRLMATALWQLYVAFTLVQIILLYLAGMNLFDAVNHAFATMATGGFSTKNASIKYYDSLAIELIIVFFMFLAGGNFGLYYLVWHKGPARLLKDSEFKVYLGIVIGATLAVAAAVWLQTGLPFAVSLRDSLFAVVSLMTTTGFVTADFDQWPPVAKIILFLLMSVGGCAGSTAGGIKVIRLIILLKDASRSLLRAVHPNLVRAVKIDGKAVSFDVLHTVLRFFFLYVLIFVVSLILVSATGMEPFDAMGAVAATLGNVGPGFGIVGPTTTFAAVHPVAKFVFILDMLFGRLEIFTLLVLLHPEFWQPYMSRRGLRLN